MSTEEKFAFDKGRLESLRKWKPEILLISDPYSAKTIDKYRPFLSDPILTDTQVLFIEQPPLLGIGDVNAPRYVSWRQGVNVEGVGLMECKDISEGRDALYELAEEFENVSIIPTMDLYTKDGLGIVRRQKDILYIDDDHLSLAGAKIAKDRISATIQMHLSTQKMSQ